MRRALTYVSLGSLTFLLGMVVCIFLRYPDFYSNDGLSFFGNFSDTFTPYALSLAATSYFLLKASFALQGTAASRPFALALEIISIGLLGIVATPSYSQSVITKDLHVLFGLAIFISQAVVSLRYLRLQVRTTLDWSLLALQIVAIIGAGLSFRTVSLLSVMFTAQLLAIVSFLALMMRALARNISQKESYN